MPGLTGFYFSYNFLLSKLEISSDASLVSMEADSPNVLFFFGIFLPKFFSDSTAIVWARHFLVEINWLSI